jgi:hypothetical protein
MPNHKKKNKTSNDSVGPNDVILGRGNHLSNSGNEKFRDLVRSRSIEYWSCSDNLEKDSIARQVADTVRSLGGRFLRSAESKVRNNDASSKSRGTANTTKSETRWEIASSPTVLLKIKQTFRDLTASVKKRSASLQANEQSSDIYLTNSNEQAYAMHSNNVHCKGSVQVSSSHHVNTSDEPSSARLKVQSGTAIEERHRQQKGSDPNFSSNITSSVSDNDTRGAYLLSALHGTLNSEQTRTSQSCISAHNNNNSSSTGRAIATAYINPNESFIENVIKLHSDHLYHRNAVDRQMMTVMLEQQSHFPKLPQQRGLACDSSSNVIDHINPTPSNDVMLSLIRAELLRRQQQQQSPSMLLQDHLNLDTVYQQQLLRTHVAQSYLGIQLPSLHSTTPLQQHSGNVDRLLSHLSPSEIANIQSSILATQVVPSSVNVNQIPLDLEVLANRYNPLLNFAFNSSGSNIASAIVHPDLQQLYLRVNNDSAAPSPKSNSDDSSGDKKPPGRR